MKQELEDIPAKDPLRMAYWRGTSEKLVVVLSGVGQDPNEYPPFEFFGSATENQKNHALFISDRSRSWLNGDGVSTQIVDTINDVAKSIGTPEIILLGNSMGGTMALMLKDMVPAKIVLAFVPQFSVSRKVVPGEKRWRKYRKNIEVYRFPKVRLKKNPDQTVFIVHGDTDPEMMHARKFPKVRGVRHFIIPGEGHNLSKKLKRKGQLAEVISAALNDKPYKFRRLMKRSGGMFISDYDADEPAQPLPSAHVDQPAALAQK
jgi:pimeloyl-ACP methyl ester carboxylesterase